MSGLLVIFPIVALIVGVVLLVLVWTSKSDTVVATSPLIDVELSQIPGNWLPVLSADQLIEKLKLESLLMQLRRESQSEASNYEGYFRPLIEQYLEFVQLVPASESHHHAQPGGLVVHTLEVAVHVLKLRQQLMLPKGGKPEDIARLRHRWTYAVLVASLLHDVGKPLSDLKISFYSSLQDAGNIWNPLSGSLKDCAAKYYIVDFLDAKERDYAAHQRMAMVLLPRCVPKAAVQWLAEDSNVMRELTDFLGGGLTQGVIVELIKSADTDSVKRNLLTGPRTRFATARTVPLIERMMEALRRMLAEGGTLPLNRNGAAGWVYKGEIYFVARRLSEEVRNYLKQNESSAGVPGDDKNDRMFDVWQDYGAVVIDETNGRAVWQISIEGLAGETFKIDRMSVLRFPLATLFDDPAKYPQQFVGILNILREDKSVAAPAIVLANSDVGESTISTNIEIVDAQVHADRVVIPETQVSKTSPPQRISTPPQVPAMVVKSTALLPKALRGEAADDGYLSDDDDAKQMKATTAKFSPYSQLSEDTVDAVVIKNVDVPKPALAVVKTLDTSRHVEDLPDAPVAAHHPAPTPLRPQTIKAVKEPPELALELLHWLRDGLVSGELVHNVKDGMVHFVDEGLLLVSPKFFRTFAEKKIGKDAVAEIAELEKKAQRSLVAAGWTLKASNNQNIVPYSVANTTKVLNGMVISKQFANQHIVEINYTNVLLKRCEPPPKVAGLLAKAPPMQAMATKTVSRADG
jgi:integrating conjugative element relaxase (TIGR03760 family)